MKKEFYFVRHGQTDHNILEGNDKGDHPEDIPLNETGRAQAKAIALLVSTLPVQTICASPLKRVQETKAIITEHLSAPHHVLPDFTECSAQIWKEMRRLGEYELPPEDGLARPFFDRVHQGIQKTLLLPGPSLIVAHGGVHWATCCLLQVEEHPWSVENCGIVHFFIDTHGKWKANKIF